MIEKCEKVEYFSWFWVIFCKNNKTFPRTILKYAFAIFIPLKLATQFNTIANIGGGLGISSCLQVNQGQLTWTNTYWTLFLHIHPSKLYMPKFKRVRIVWAKRRISTGIFLPCTQSHKVKQVYMCKWSKWLEEFEPTYVLTTSRFWVQVSWKIENITCMNSPSQFAWANATY